MSEPARRVRPSPELMRRQTWSVRRLPWHHRDPFDRLLIAQAQDLGVPIVTRDAAFGAYDVTATWPRS